MCCGNEAGSYSRLKDSSITQLKAQRPSRTCNESKEEQEEAYLGGADSDAVLARPGGRNRPAFESSVQASEFGV